MTSGPQDPHQGGYGQQPPEGRPPEYGQGSRQYGGRPPWEQDGSEQSSYPAAPAGHPGGEVGAPTERPTTVKAGIAAFLVNTLLNALGSILLFTDLEGYRAELAEIGGLTDEQVSTAATVGFVISLVFIVAFLAVLWFAWQGRNWARIVLWVLGGLSLLAGLTGTMGTGGFLAVLQLMLVLAGIVLLALKPSNDWYRAEAQRRKRF
ncbi:DUF6264 family protein [Modestobacter sp. VKM Ac-2985]|uniref:DUF6264 family protein n=1 Tax=Modestobacter sp. VKM Ac-2985 TaxID=3004139 RepID=UPI0022AB7669|nr:DUF6264 family protein [Modestobacter sp. VKM Ac-2985]MCZ2838198.1 DUF6264 family protein [Modestobacter sp. VKM Ac-2985]